MRPPETFRILPSPLPVRTRRSPWTEATDMFPEPLSRRAVPCNPSTLMSPEPVRTSRSTAPVTVSVRSNEPLTESQSRLHAAEATANVVKSMSVPRRISFMSPPFVGCGLKFQGSSKSETQAEGLGEQRKIVVSSRFSVLSSQFSAAAPTLTDDWYLSPDLQFELFLNLREFIF